MKFGPVPITEAQGALNVHMVRAGERTLRKGARVTAEDVVALQAAGIAEIVAACLEPGDVPENDAAERLARAAAGEGVRVDAPFTGRANLFAEQAGVLLIATERVDAMNAADERLTFATLPAFKPVVAGEMVATAKVIPYAVPGEAVAEAVAALGGKVVAVAPYRVRALGVISTLLPMLKPTTIDKTLRVMEARLAPTGASIVAQERVPHEPTALAQALRRQADGDAEMIVVFGASAIADRHDVIPAAIEAAGGHVEHFGMPVDPGNLLLIGRIGGKPVLGAPGCARSPKENGFDWVLHRLLAGLAVTRADIVRMGVGGLLMEIVSRPQPRAGGESGEEDEA